jgi:hypothetical protein
MAMTQLDSLSSSASFAACGSTMKVICRFKDHPFLQTRPPICGPKEEHTSKPHCRGNYSKRLITTNEHFGVVHGAGQSTIRELEQWMPQGKRRKLWHHQGGGGCGFSSSSSPSSSSQVRNEIIFTPTQTPSPGPERRPPTVTEAIAHEQHHATQETLTPQRDASLIRLFGVRQCDLIRVENQLPDLIGLCPAPEAIAPEQHHTTQETLTRQREASLIRLLGVQQRELISVENHNRDLISLYRRKKAQFKDLRRQESSANSRASEFKSLKSTLCNLWDGQLIYMKTRMHALKAIESTERKLRIVRNGDQIVELKAEIELLAKQIGVPTVGSDGELMNPLDVLD